MTTFLNYSQIDESLTFSDGQPHIIMDKIGSAGANDIYDLECRISSPADLLKVGMAINVLKKRNWKVRLTIYYLLGARMDRSLSDAEPYTLQVIADIINSFGAFDVKIFCPHSQASTDLIKNSSSMKNIEDIFFDIGIIKAMKYFLEPIPDGVDYRAQIRDMSDLTLVFPDLGASKRFHKSLIFSWYNKANIVVLDKDRDERTGRINEIVIHKGTPTNYCIILDDLCDGGATFKLAGKLLKDNGSTKNGLVVPHGIFSKGRIIEDIDFITTTNSFMEWKSEPNFFVHKIA